MSREKSPATSNEEESFIGQTFRTEEEAYTFYKNYAEIHGFAIRKDRSDKKHDKIVRRDFSWHRGRKKPIKVVGVSKDPRNRESSRCQCPVHMRISLRKSFEIFPEEWHVIRLVKAHNHILLSVYEMRFLPSNRINTPKYEKKILLFNEAGLSIRQIIRVMELDKKVQHGDLSFIGKDVRNLITKVKKMIGAYDASDFIEHMKLVKEEKFKCQYAYTIDE